MGNKSSTSTFAKLPVRNDGSSIDMYDNDNKESTILIWFDPDFESQRDAEQTTQHLRDINDYVKFYKSVDSCVKFIKSIDREKIFLIICGSMAEQLLSHISGLRQVDSIFLYCTETQSYEHLVEKHSKIIGIYSNRDELDKAIQSQINLVDHQLQTFSFFDQNRKTTKDLTKESGEFIWFQLLNHIIARCSQTEDARQKMIDMCKQYYYGNAKMLTLVDQFESEYRSGEAIYWYTTQSFIFKLISKALRSFDIETIYALRYFLNDLFNYLRQEHQNILLSNDDVFVVYRGGKLDIEEFNRLKENQGKLVSTNGYLLTTRHRSKAQAFSMKLPKRTDSVVVLFQIDVHKKQIGHSIYFADIVDLNENANDDRVLFDLNACFKIESIEQDQSFEIIKMKLSNAGEMITKDYVELTLRETEETSPLLVFGSLMCDLGQYDKAKMYFEELLNNPNGEDLAWIEFNIGRILRLKGNCIEARQHFDRAYNRMMNNKPARIRDSTHILDEIGLSLESQGLYDEAFNYYKQALDIKEKYHLPGSINIATSFSNIGNILSLQKKYDEALDFYKQALDIEEKCYPSGHVTMATSHSKIGNTLRGQRKFDAALKYYQRALEMQEEHYPSGHVDIAHSLHDIGHILLDQAKTDEALDYYQRALQLRDKYYPHGHIAVVQSLTSIGSLLFEHERYDEALDYYQRLLEIQEHYYSSDELDIAQSLSRLGQIYCHQHKYGTALHYCQQALKIKKKHYSFDHADMVSGLQDLGSILFHQKKYEEALDCYQQILKVRQTNAPLDPTDSAHCLYQIGNILKQQHKYNEALEHYQKALKLQEKCDASNQIEIATTFSSIGHILEKQDKYEEALDNYQRSLKIQEDYYSFGHACIADNLHSIGSILYHQRKYDDALVYYQRSLKMQEEYYRSGHVDIVQNLYSIGIIFFDQKKYDEALENFKRALKMLETYCASDHIHIGQCLNSIGLCHEKQDKIKIALDYYHQAISIFKQCLPADHSNCVELHNRIHRLTKINK